MKKQDAVKPVKRGATMRAFIDRTGNGRPSLLRFAVLCGALLLGLAACEGDNLFNGGSRGIGGPPVVTSVVAPTTAREGDKVDVRVKAIGRRGIVKIDVRFRGAVNVDKSIVVEPSSPDTVTVDVSVDLPAAANDSTLRIEATATDQFGGVSEIVARTVRITDSSAPNVSATVGSTTASAGGTIKLTISARDELGLKQVGYAVVTAKGDTLGGIPTLINASGITRDTVFNIQLPATLQPSEVKVIGIAVNASNQRGVSIPLAVTVVDQLKPTVLITEPNDGDSYPLRDSIAIRVRVADASGIASVTLRGISFRFFPDSTQNATPIVRFPAITIPFPQGPDRPLPIDTTLFRYLKPTTDTTSEPVYLIVEARDAQGNVGVDTVRIIAGPRVVILNPVTGAIARVNSDLLIRMQANDPQAGLDSLKLFVTGVQQDSFVFKNLGSTREQIERTATLRIGGQTGQITLRAQVFNSLGVRGTTSNAPIINITTQLSGDTVAPRVQRLLISADRIELNDSIKVRVTATDDAGSGITRIGAVVITIPANESALVPRDTFYLLSRVFSPALGGTPDTTFSFQLSDTYKETGAARFPLPFTIQVHAFAIDGQGLCGASVQESMQSLLCQAIPGQAGFFVAAGQTGRVYNPTAVIGSSVGLPFGAEIADAIADTLKGRLYLSNFSGNQVEVLSMADTALKTPIGVGSQPWGLFLIPGRTSPDDTLMVANSGGTNISFVPTNTLLEDPTRRLLTPNEQLFEINEDFVNGFLRYSAGRTLDFSDRPQFIAEDRNGVILYSTKPTTAAQPGTIRKALADPTPAIPNDTVRPEPSILFTRDGISPSTSVWAIAHVDSIRIIGSALTDDQAIIFDHVPGFPTRIIKSYGGTANYISSDMFADLAARGSDATGERGIFNLGAIALKDTTFVAASGDMGTIAFGEGATPGTGRIFLWTAGASAAGGGINASGTADLVGNASERVTGLSLSRNGKLGVGRGTTSTYFFSNNVQEEGVLRLQGIFGIGVAGGNGGVALHPHHTDVVPSSTFSNDSTIAFIATSNRSIKVVDTFHFFERGDVPIRDNIIGQLRAARAPASANIGLTPAKCDYTVAQLYGVTATNNVVIVNVRKRDILKGTNQTCTP
ncbi:MAG: hypothetical protein ABIV28_04620 [Longimicrobiales bacterium]